ncbi:sucrase-isomaltase, intestinal-like [Amphiura filiformis]|uniref:sucrase-isomaltase, intestinal-like n=1 Tax=Amphiura filiformis TaxID=82378 RepID=UPI003B210A82
MARGVLIGGLVCLALVTVGVVVFVSVWFTRDTEEPPTPDERFYDEVKDWERFDCHPESGETQELCEARGCFWKAVDEDDLAPRCFYPLTFGYELIRGTEGTELGWSAKLSRIEGLQSRYGMDIDKLHIDVEHQTETRMHFKIIDASKPRFEIPLFIDKPSVKPVAPAYEVAYKESPFSLQISRKGGPMLFDTSFGGFTYEDQFLQISTKLPSTNIYGFGEHNHRQFRHNLNWKTWAMFARDVAPVDEWNLYGHQPFYMCVEEDGKAHGVLFLNNNAMDVVLQPLPGLTYRAIGGVLDFYIFVGDSPEHVVQLYTEAIGRQDIPPYWGLGFQLSRWNYGSLDRVKQVVQELKDADIPHDVQYGDIDYMDEKKDFTWDKVKFAGLPEYVDQLHADGMKYIIILDGFIKHAPGENYHAYDRGVEMDIFIKDPGGVNDLIGNVWPGDSVYPDYTLNKTTDYWTQMCEEFYQEIKYDALWIDMNEPSNFYQGSIDGCNNNRWNYPPYYPRILGNVIYDKTICMDAVQHIGSHYNTHSLFGHTMSISSYEALKRMWPTKRGVVLTRSSFVGTSRYAAHWLGDNQSFWSNMGWSIIGMLEFSLFGFPYTGSDICGFWFNTTESMCQRWMQLGAFYPYSRNHNGDGSPDQRMIPQHPTAFSDEMSRVSREVLLIRYRLLPFLYTLMYEATVKGSTVVRPLMHEFNTDAVTYDIDRQFLWGPSLLITPVLEEGATSVEGYFPDARWYDYYTGEELESVYRGTTKVLSAPMDYINLHVRGGFIIPTQMPARTTVLSRQLPMGVLVALGDGPNYPAMGNLFWDDGESRDTEKTGAYLLIEMSCMNSQLTLTPVNDGYRDADSLFFEHIRVFGQMSTPTRVLVNAKEIFAPDYQYDANINELFVRNQNLPITQSHTIKWL